MSERHTYSAVSYLPDCDPVAADQVADILERWRKKSENHYSDRRKDHRFPYPNSVLIVATIPADEATGNAPLHIVVQTHTRNLSCGGMSLLLAPTFVPQNPGPATPTLHADRIFTTGRMVSVGLPRQGDDCMWMRGTIVRCRIVHFGFRECGISFLARQENEEAEEVE